MKPFVRTLASALTLALIAVGAHAADEARRGSGAPGAAAANPGAHQAAPQPFLARINDKLITAAEFDAAAADAVRRKFYHGTPPEAEVEQLIRDVANGMIDRILLLDEIKRLGLKADAKVVDEQIAAYEKRYAASQRWQQEREKILPPLRARLEDDAALEALEAKTRAVPAATEEKVHEYYKKHPEKFTEPEKMRISLILLKVDPAAPTSDWQAAEAKAGALRIRIAEGGANFAAVARESSDHESADAGGDLGYLHQGMLLDGIQEKINTMKPGDLSQPTRVLQGYALFRYESLQPPKHHEFATVKGRAGDLLAREQGDNAWNKLREQLRKKAKIVLNTERYPALAKQAQAAK